MNLFRATALVAGLASPAFAFERASTQECTEMVQSVVSAVQLDWSSIGDIERARPYANASGFCLMTPESAGLQSADFKTIEWRVQGINRVIQDGLPPEKLEFFIRDAPRPGSGHQGSMDVHVILSHDQASRSLLVESVELSTPDGNTLQFTAVLNHLDFSSRGAAAMSLGGVSLSQAAGRLQVVGDQDILDVRSESQSVRTELLEGLAAMPAEILRSSDVAALGDFLDPTSRDGQLNFTLRSSRGIGLLQVFVRPFVFGVDGEDGAHDALEMVLDGVNLTFDWVPAETIQQ
jgi:hypothetical protein